MTKLKVAAFRETQCLPSHALHLCNTGRLFLRFVITTWFMLCMRCLCHGVDQSVASVIFVHCAKRTKLISVWKPQHASFFTSNIDRTSTQFSPVTRRPTQKQRAIGPSYWVYAKYRMQQKRSPKTFGNFRSNCSEFTRNILPTYLVILYAPTL